MEEHVENNTNNINQNEKDNQEMNTNDIHEIMHDPYKFYIPNPNHEPSIQEEQYEESNITDNSTHEYNETDEYIMNALFDNPEEEIIFNDNEIDEDELNDDNENENNIVTDQHDNLYPDEGNLINHEPNEDYQNESNKRAKNSNTIIQRFQSIPYESTKQQKSKEGN